MHAAIGMIPFVLLVLMGKMELVSGEPGRCESLNLTVDCHGIEESQVEPNLLARTFILPTSTRAPCLQERGRSRI